MRIPLYSFLSIVIVGKENCVGSRVPDSSRCIKKQALWDLGTRITCSYLLELMRNIPGSARLITARPDVYLA
jgi:hypothetical protein